TAQSVERAVTFAKALGKDPIEVKDAPGFASSRLGVALGLEAMRMLEQGVASAEDIDKAMELGYNHPMGPLKLTDLVGLDVRLAIAEYLYRALEDQQFQPPTILRDKVAKGELGKKTGKGVLHLERLTRITDVHVHIQPWRDLKPKVQEAMRRGKEAHWEFLQSIMDDPKALLQILDQSGVWRIGMVNYYSPDVSGFTNSTNTFAAKYAQANPERL